MRTIYLNLTNGIEYIDNLSIDDIKFVRIQSSLCEAKAWNKIIYDLDYNFLMDIALGKNVCIIDYSGKKTMTRALYQGIEFIKTVLYYRWLNKEYRSSVHGVNCYDYFSSISLDKYSKKKIDYFKKFISKDMTELHIATRCFPTKHDNDYEWYKNKLEELK